MWRHIERLIKIYVDRFYRKTFCIDCFQMRHVVTDKMKRKIDAGLVSAMDCHIWLHTNRIFQQFTIGQLAFQIKRVALWVTVFLEERS